MIVARHSTSFTQTWHHATLALAHGVFLFFFFFFSPHKNISADLLLKYFGARRGRTGLVPPLGTLFHSVMTCAQLLGPPHNQEWFPPRLLFIIKQATAPVLTGWSMTLPQRLLTYCIVRYTLKTEAPRWSAAPPRVTYIFRPTVYNLYWGNWGESFFFFLWDFSLSVRIMPHQTSQHRNCTFWWVNNAAFDSSPAAAATLHHVPFQSKDTFRS